VRPTIGGLSPPTSGSFVAHAHPGRTRAPRWIDVAGVVGELLLTAGLVVLLFVVYELFVTDLLNQGKQSDLSRSLHEQWEHTPPAATTAPRADLTGGNAFAVLHIPRLGKDYQRVVLEGTAEKELSQGPGHYAGTAQPGEPGNMGLAGHRVGKGSPFLDLDQLRPGDPIVVETVDSWFVYRVLGDVATGDLTADPSGIPGQEIVRPTDVEVLSPTPDGPEGAAPTGSYLTLTTRHPLNPAPQSDLSPAPQEAGALPNATPTAAPPALTEGT
jgi:sortase (surface protein transpeptidase)